MIAQFTGADQRTWDEHWPELQLATTAKCTQTPAENAEKLKEIFELVRRNMVMAAQDQARHYNLRRRPYLPYVRSCRYLGITVSEGMKFLTRIASQVLGGAPPLDLAAKLLAVKYKLKRGYPLEENDWLYSEDITCLSWKQRNTRLDECLLQSWQNRWDDDSEPGRVTHHPIRHSRLSGSKLWILDEDVLPADRSRVVQHIYV
ncbi:GM26671 [Drosophila sechellia]|uniref:GM26671 n=1 Tax=Drosophila sechellia TaxID=7238 RepID=B4IP44_DROSE|nr:GM26671 [Drosophila sechellia]